MRTTTPHCQPRLLRDPPRGALRDRPAHPAAPAPGPGPDGLDRLDGGRPAAGPARRPVGRAAGALLALVLAGCASVTNPVTGERELSVMDERAEIAEGAKAHPQVLKEYPPLADERLQAYVKGIGAKLAAQSHRSNLPWTFTVLDSPEVNAFALPGGYVYVTRGIMAYLESEAELAGVIGHEIGHVTARHGAQRATSQARAGIGVIAATVLGAVAEAAGVPGATQAAGNLAQGVAAGTIARYGREQELQADQLGAEYLSKTRYDPGNMVHVIRVLKDQELFAADAAKAAGRAPPSAPGWLASHPSSDQRLAQIRGIAAEWAKKGGKDGAQGWEDDGRERYLRALEGVTFGDGREQGVVRGRHFFHEPLGIALTAPPNWRIANGAEQLVVMNADRDAALILRPVPPDVIAKTGRDHEAILKQALGATEGRTEKLQLGGGLPATHFAGQRRASNGQVGPLEATLADGPNQTVYLMLWASKDAATRERARPSLREIERSFRPLAAADRAAARPYRIRTLPMPAGGFAALARSSPLTELAEQQLRLLNGVYGGAAEPKAGTLVKTIE